MNPALNVIFSRRSVRKFHDRAIPDALIRDLLEAAMAAPSAMAKDPWHFIVVRRRNTLDRLVDILPNGAMLRQSTGAIIVCGDLTVAHDGLESYMLQDLSAAVENILIAAPALGLGACWLGVHPRQPRMDGIRSLFDLPEPIVPVAGVALGYPREQPGPRTRFLAGRVHQEGW